MCRTCENKVPFLVQWQVTACIHRGPGHHIQERDAKAQARLNIAKAREQPKHQPSELQAGFLCVPFKGPVGTRRQEETLHSALSLTCSNEEVNLFVCHFQSLLCVYIKKGQPRLWAQTEGAWK